MACTVVQTQTMMKKAVCRSVQTGSLLARLALSVRDFVSTPFILADVKSRQRLWWYFG